MAERFTGFWEDQDGAVYTTIASIPLDELLERLRKRLEQMEPGGRVRIDLISWADE